MANIIVVTFKEEIKAIEALNKIKELDVCGEIILYDHIIIREKENNQYEVLSDQTSGAGWRIFTGIALGSLVGGALSGSIGFIIGLYTGFVAGIIWGIIHFNVQKNFIQKVTNRMTTGTIAIIAEVAEENPNFLDDALKAFRLEGIRSEVGIEFDDYQDEQIEEFEEVENELDELKKARGKVIQIT